MSKSKVKMRPLGWKSFLVLWVILAVVIDVVSRIARDALIPGISPVVDLGPSLAVSILFWALLAWGQVYLLQRLLRRTLTYWIPASVIGGIASVIIAIGIYDTRYMDLFAQFPPVVQFAILELPIMLVPNILQWLVLRNKVKNAWLWIVAVLISLLPFVGLNLFIDTVDNTSLIQAAWVGHTAIRAAIIGFFALLIVFLTRGNEHFRQHTDAVEEDEVHDIRRLVDSQNDQKPEESHLAQQGALGN
ncbi:MAG: hypothetical protein KC708_07835 [Anaerolineae bacterium]|nr:hypothetical protein [Anaerolineae bacterium]